jgi:two-component system NarL family response regulator
MNTEKRNAEKRIRLLIADDHAIVRDGLVAILERQEDMEVVAEAANGQEAVERFRRYRPDITLMDIQMPEMDGIQATNAIHQDFPQAKIIMLTSFEGEEDIYQSLRAGAKTYLLKNLPREQLLTAIRQVYEGHATLPPYIAGLLVVRIGHPHLTARERDVLAKMVEGKSNQEIGTALYIAEGTVKSHVNSILSKLGVSDRTQAVTTALKRGLARLS